MKIKAIKRYKDAYENKLIEVGTVYETTDERAKLIISKGFAKEVVKPRTRKRK